MRERKREREKKMLRVRCKKCKRKIENVSWRNGWLICKCVCGFRIWLKFWDYRFEVEKWVKDRGLEIEEEDYYILIDKIVEVLEDKNEKLEIEFSLMVINEEMGYSICDFYGKSKNELLKVVSRNISREVERWSYKKVYEILSKMEKYIVRRYE